MSVFAVADTKSVVADAPVFPSENPDKQRLKEYRELIFDDFLSCGYGPLLAGKTPPELVRLQPRGHITVADSAADSVKASVLLKNGDIDHTNVINAAELDDKMVELRRRLGARLCKSMRPKVPNRLKKLVESAVLKNKAGDQVEGVDGVVLWAEIDKMCQGKLLYGKVKEHQLEVECLRDLPVPDNASIEVWDARLVDFNKHNEHIEVPYAQARLSKVLFGMTPKALAVEMRVVKRELEAAGTMNDTVAVGEAIAKAIDAAHDPAAKVEVMMTASAVKAEVARKVNEAIAKVQANHNMPCSCRPSPHW